MLILTKEIEAGCEIRAKGAVYQGVWFLGGHICASSRSITYGALLVGDFKSFSCWTRLCVRGSTEEAMFRFQFHFSKVLCGRKRFNECVGILHSLFERLLSFSLDCSSLVGGAA